MGERISFDRTLYLPEAVAAAFPQATTASMELKPSVNPEFDALLRDFCASLPADSEAVAD
jgi:hypothetical protein